ncbi:hypothetical protein EGW08_021110 [Elysia chlorotica]|uniref:DH domain-containing protein n=1 Tax=Elysia chlorotica TaxID=188477 RepID=A0A3S1B3J8_ELYCH|nr:hypothetical protein EGW08_021110 [Elysia chlorotica]
MHIHHHYNHYRHNHRPQRQFQEEITLPPLFYHTPVIPAESMYHPAHLSAEKVSPTSLTSSDPSQTTGHTDPSGLGKIYYLSTAVPVFEDPGSVTVTTTTTLEAHSPEVLQSSASSGSSSMNRSANRGVQGGSGQAVPVDFLNPLTLPDHVTSKGTEYSRLYFRSTNQARVTESQKRHLTEGGYGSLSSLASQGSVGSYHGNSADGDDISLDWGSEFDDDDESVDVEEVNQMLRQMDQEAAASAQADKPLPPKPHKPKGGFSPTNLLFRQQTPGPPTSTFYNALETGCLPVFINPEKHPPPELPPCPEGLSENQKKRRMIIELIISSERSYMESLERVIKDYERAILEFIPGLKSSLRPVFTAMREIVSHHKMFQIELAESVKNWDRNEKIGDIFTASFSKTMLVQAYSTFVNNFAQGMDEIRSLQRTRQNFDDFLRKQEKLGADRLSIFGLMVKPVQRFPQFIMVLQDLIKYTPRSHPDRGSLQLALTELETVAYQLNERKRRSEQKFQARQVTRSLARQKISSLLTGGVGGGLEGDAGGVDGRLAAGDRRLIRFDDVEQVFGDFGSMKSKPRRLILMNDLIMCCKVIEKEQAGYRVEKLDLKWMAKLSDLELKDTTMTPDMERVLKKEPGKIHLITSQLEKPEDDPFHLYADLREMLHDYSKLEQVISLLGSLKRSYTSHGLREELVHEVCQDLENMIHIKDEQLRVVNSCTIQLVNHSRSDKPQYVIQTQTAAGKEDWCTDLILAKLAREKSNKLAWDAPSSSDETEFDVVPAHFMKHIVVDRPKNYTKIRCASPIFLHPDKSPFGLGVQHLWVCSSTPTHGQVSVLSIHNSRPALVESFKACSCDIMAAELVPGCGVDTNPDQFIFSQDTVWVATAQRQIIIFPLTSEDGVRRNPLAVFSTPSVTVSFKFVDERLFCGFENGTMNVFSRITSGGWTVSRPTQLKFGTAAIRLHFIHEEDIWLSCGSKLLLVEIDSLLTKSTHTLSANFESGINQVVKAGVGIWVSFTDSAYIKLYHIETMENLQEISIGNFVHRIKTEKLWTLNGNTENLVVMSLAESKGLLWIGTSVGVVLTLPLPRLSDGVPLYRGRPSISMHAHRSPVRFLVALHCATSTLEMNRNSSLRYTLRQRQSRRNLEREKVELEESHKRRMAEQGELLVEVDSPTGVNGTTLLDCVPDADALRDSTAACWGSEASGEYVSEREIQEAVSQAASPTTQGSTQKSLKKWDENGEYSLAKVNSSSNPSLTELVGQREGAQVRSSMHPAGSNGPGVTRKESLDDTAVAMRRKLSFRSELANRIMVTSRTMSRSHVDLSSYMNEVEMYYDYLLEDAASDIDEEDFSEDDEEQFNNVENSDGKGKAEKKDKKDKKKPSKDKAKMQVTKEKTATNHKLSKRSSILKRSSEPVIDKNGVTLRLPASGKERGDNPLAVKNSAVSPAGTLTSPISTTPKSFGGAGGFLRGTGARASTSRKANTNNAVIVLSGGDGYCDLDASRSQFKTDDACVQLWLYKY